MNIENFCSMKITENLVKGLSNGKSFSTIQTLNLSDQGIVGSLDTSIIEKLTKLTVLDISQNEVTDIPSSLSLKQLETLDCSYNNLTSLAFLNNFKKCKQLYIDGNDNIQLADKIKLFRMHPNIDYIDDIKRSSIRNFRDKWEVMVKSKWEVLFAAKYAEGFNPDQFDSILRDFYSTLTSDLLFKNITDEVELTFLMDLAEEIVNKAQDGTLFNEGSMSKGTPRSARLNHKFLNKESPASAKNTPKQKSRTTPNNRPSRKRGRETPSDSPSSRPSKRARSKTPLTKDVRRRSFTALKKKELACTGRCPAVGDFDPVYFIRCHSADNDPSDEKTKVWRCAFEPSINDDCSSRLLATCGGQNVCLIDCQTGKVMKRYKDTSKEEDFYAMAWTTLSYETENREEKTNILAVGGNNGYIKLIHPSQFVMYATLEGHHDYISCLLFHPEEPTYLFSGAKDRKIILWDIGIPDFQNYTTNYQKLLVLNTVHTDALNLVFSTASQILIAGCEKSCYGWKFNDLNKVTKDPNVEFLIPSTLSDIESGESDEVEVVDGLALLPHKFTGPFQPFSKGYRSPNDYVASKCSGSGHLVVWNLEKSLPQKWVKGTQTVEVKVSSLLEYTKTNVDYINLGSNTGVLSAGTDKGSVYLYQMEGFADRPKHSVDEILRYSLVLEWPEVNLDQHKDRMEELPDFENVVVNCCCTSKDQLLVACGTDNNLVCIWKRN